jgi:hypothetical protein
MTTHSMELLTCSSYGCPGCGYRHFLRTSDDSQLTEVPDAGLFTAEQLGVLGRAALATGAVSAADGPGGPG